MEARNSVRAEFGLPLEQEDPPANVPDNLKQPVVELPSSPDQKRHSSQGSRTPVRAAPAVPSATAAPSATSAPAATAAPGAISGAITDLKKHVQSSPGSSVSSPSDLDGSCLETNQKNLVISAEPNGAAVDNDISGGDSAALRIAEFSVGAARHLCVNGTEDGKVSMGGRPTPVKDEASRKIVQKADCGNSLSEPKASGSSPINSRDSSDFLAKDLNNVTKLLVDQLNLALQVGKLTEEIKEKNQLNQELRQRVYELEVALFAMRMCGGDAGGVLPDSLNHPRLSTATSPTTRNDSKLLSMMMSNASDSKKLLEKVCGRG